MSTLPPPPPNQFAATAGRGPVPPDISGPLYNIGLTILLSIVTCGVWTFIWTYRTFEDLKKHNNDGIGGAVGVIINLFVSPVIMFLAPMEIEKMYQRAGRQSPVSPLLGLWFLLPLIGNIIWYVKVQNALNDYWRANGSAG